MLFLGLGISFPTESKFFSLQGERNLCYINKINLSFKESVIIFLMNAYLKSVIINISHLAAFFRLFY